MTSHKTYTSRWIKACALLQIKKISTPVQ